jgi:AAA+ superfamily predicted ATPase
MTHDLSNDDADDFDDLEQETSDPGLPDDPTTLAALLLVRRAIASPDLRAQATTPGSVTLITAPGAEWVTPLGDAWRIEAWRAHRYAGSNGGMSVGSPSGADRTAPCRALLPPRTPQQADELLGQARRALARGEAVVGFDEPGARMPDALVAAADLRLTIPHPDGSLLTEAAGLLAGAPAKAAFPDDLARHVAAADLWLARRPGQTADEWLARLRAMAERRSTVRSVADAPTLDELAGMPDAVAAGLAIVRDLHDYRAGRIPWSQVAPGLLLHGPPGTGKNLFARALARSAAVPLLTGSLAEWQASRTGHLGDLLAAMRGRFAEARAVAPAILFIDEIDAFGDRATFSSQHRDYSTQVVNALLELLDGVTGRPGVVVLGACNNVGNLDPAIRRSGRLDRSIEVPLPDAEGLVAILRHHLGGDLPEVDLAALALPLLGATGADVARLVRDARRHARIANRPLLLEDLHAALGMSANPRTSAYRRLLAVHEAGHTVVGVINAPGTLIAVTLRATGPRAAATHWQPESERALTRAGIDALLQRLLAGRAAEAVLLGSVSAGAGGAAESDLARATQLAAAAVGALGLGDSLVWTGLPEPNDVPDALVRQPVLAQAVAAQLDAADATARALVVKHRPAVEAVAEQLLTKGSLSGPEVTEILAANPPAEATP